MMRATIAAKTAEALGLLGLHREDIELECHMDSATGQAIVLVDVRLNLPALRTCAPHVEAFVIEHLSLRYGLRLSKLRMQMVSSIERAEGALRPQGQRPQVPCDAEQSVLLNPSALTVQRPAVRQPPDRQGPHGEGDAGEGRSPGQASAEVRTDTPALASCVASKSLFSRYAEAFVYGMPPPCR